MQTLPGFRNPLSFYTNYLIIDTDDLGRMRNFFSTYLFHDRSSNKVNFLNLSFLDIIFPTFIIQTLEILAKHVERLKILKYERHKVNEVCKVKLAAGEVYQLKWLDLVDVYDVLLYD